MADDERRGDRGGARRRESARPQRTTPSVIDLEANKPEGAPEVPSREPVPDPVLDATPSPVEIVPDAQPMAFEKDVAASESVKPAAFDKPMSGVEPAPIEPTPVEPTRETSRSESVSSGREPKRPSIIPALAALVVAILAAGWIYLYNELSAVQGDDRAQIAALQTKIAGLEARPVPDTAALTQKIDSASAQSRDGLNALQGRVDGLQAAAGADPKRVETVEADLKGVQASVGALQEKVSALPKPDLSRIDQDIGNLGQKLTQLQSVVGAIPHVDLGPLTGKVDALGGKVDDIEARLKPLEAEAEAARSPQRVAERRAAPVAVTAQAIVEAIAAGQAFPHEFAALQALGTDPAKLAPLQTVAGAGAPSLGDLQANLAELRDKIVAQGAPKPNGSYFDRIMAGAGSLVQVRPLGSVVGDTPAAIVARMNAAIGADELARALHDWEALPEPSRDVSKALADRLRLRLEAEEAAKGIAANAIGAMAATRG